jgi:hypothetical protein
MNWIELGRVAGSCECGNECTVCIKKHIISVPSEDLLAS